MEVGNIVLNRLDQLLELLFKNSWILPFVILFILILTTITNKYFIALLDKYVSSKSKKFKIDKTQFVILKHLISGIIYLLGISFSIYLIPPLKAVSISIFASAGVVAVIAGFASQKTLSNVISGIFIAIFQPFRVGDIIKFEKNVGVVEDINLRHTIIRNFENKRIIVPNSVISETIIENYDIDDEKICRFIEFNISYDSDIDKAIHVMAQQIKKHKDFLDIRTESEKLEHIPAVKIKVIGFGESSIKLRAWVWAKDPITGYYMNWDLNKDIKEAFDKNEIEIPYPYRTIIYKEGKIKKNSRRKRKKKDVKK